MGTKNSKPLRQKTLQQTWQLAAHSLPLHDIYQHYKDDLLAQKSVVRVDPKYTVPSQLQVYEWRKTNNSALVRTYDAQEIVYSKEEKKKNKNNSGICAEEHDITVMTQPIVKRFSELPQLTFPQALYSLRQSLKAYEEVYNRIGPIHVNEQIIGINRFGQLKCWIHQKWAENHPQQSMERNVLKSTKYIPREKFGSKLSGEQLTYSMIEPKYRDQSDMTRNVIDVIEGKCQQGRYPKDFSDYMFIKGSNFREARAFLQEYGSKNSIMIPNRIIENNILIKSIRVQQSKHQQINPSNSAVVVGNSVVQVKDSLVKTRPEVTVNSFIKQQPPLISQHVHSIRQPMIKRTQHEFRNNVSFQKVIVQPPKYNYNQSTIHSLPSVITTKNTINNQMAYSNTNLNKGNLKISYQGANTHNYNISNGHYRPINQQHRNYNYSSAVSPNLGNTLNYASTAHLSDSLQIKNPEINDRYITSSLYKDFKTSSANNLNNFSITNKDYSLAYPNMGNTILKKGNQGLKKNYSMAGLNATQTSTQGPISSLISRIPRVQSKDASRNASFSYADKGPNSITKNTAVNRNISFGNKY